MSEKKERKPPLTIYGVNDRVVELENRKRLTLSDLLYNPSPQDLSYLQERVEHFAPKPKVLRWPRLLTAFLLGCYCMALGLTVWYPRERGPIHIASGSSWHGIVTAEDEPVTINLPSGLPAATLRPGETAVISSTAAADNPPIYVPLVKTDPKHLSITNTGQKRCWVGMKDRDGSIIRQDYLDPDATEGTDAAVGTVRDSCPGELTFERDGKMLNPTPEPGHRHDVEVVTLP